MRLPALHFQLYDHIPTMASYQTSIISLGVQPPLTAMSRDNFQPRAQIKRLFEESKLVSGDSGAIRKFSDKYIVAEKLVAEYAEHLAQIKMRKEKKKKRRLKGSAMIKAHIGMLLYDSVECQQSRRPLAKKCAVASDFITFRGGNWLAKWCSGSSCRFKPE